MTRTPRSVGGRVASASKLRSSLGKAHKGTIIGTGNAGSFAPVLLALAATTQPAQALQPVPRLDDARAFPPLVPRGTIAVATLRGKYGARKIYDFSDIVSLAMRIEKKEVTLIDIKKDKSHEKFKVPYSTMRDWLKDDALVMEKKGKRGVSGTPHWKVERDVRRRTELSKPGPGPVLGAGEKALIVKMADAANRGMPFSDEEIGDVLRDSAIKLKLKHPGDGKPYTLNSDVRSLTAGFLRRADEAGITFENKEGRSFARVRANSATLGILVKYRDDVVEPALALFQQEQKVTLGLEDIINWDEAMLDLNDFALGNAYFLQNFGNNVVTPWERCPHITVVTGFAGRVHLVVLMIFKGPDDKPPHPFKAQLLTGGTLYIAQSEKGWMTKKLKNEFFDLQVKAAHVPIGQRPLAGNVDGHCTNAENLVLAKKMIDAKVCCFNPPPHTSGDLTQQCDLPRRLGGPIAMEKGRFRVLMRRQLRSNMEAGKSYVTDAEAAALYEKAVFQTWDPATVASMNEAVGYYKGADGILHCDVTRVMNIASVSRGGDGGAAAAAVPSARRGMRKAVHERQVETLAALKKMRAELRAVDESLSMAAAPVVPTPTAIPRSRAKHPTGLVVTGLDHLNELKAAQAERLAKADKAAAKKREFWENHRKKIRAAQARLVEKKTPSKLKVSEQAALILDRTGHHTKLNSKKRDPAGDTLICAELRRVLNDPSLLPATPVADDSDASEVPEPADEGSCPCGTTPMAGAAYCHACGRQL